MIATMSNFLVVTIFFNNKKTPTVNGIFHNLETSSFDSSNLKWCNIGMTCSSKTSDSSAILKSLGISALDSVETKSKSSGNFRSKATSPCPIFNIREESLTKSPYGMHFNTPSETSNVELLNEGGCSSSDRYSSKRSLSPNHTTQHLDHDRIVKSFKTEIRPNNKRGQSSLSISTHRKCEITSSNKDVKDSKQYLQLVLPEKFSPIACPTFGNVNKGVVEIRKDDHKVDVDRSDKWRRWTAVEDNLLRQAVEMEPDYPRITPNWKAISKKYFFGKRNHIQCKNRWIKVRMLLYIILTTNYCRNVVLDVSETL